MTQLDYGIEMIEAVLCDMDNTIIDFTSFKEGTALAAAHAMVRNGLPVMPKDAYARIFLIYDEKGMEYEKTYFEVVNSFRIPDLNKAERIQQAAILAHQKAMQRALNPYPMVKPTLRALRRMGIKLGLVTDGPRNKVWKRLIIVSLSDQFDIVVTHSDTREYKPHPLPFQMALDELGIPAQRCLFVGDNPGRDIRGAKDIGMRTCLAEYGSKGVKLYGPYKDAGEPVEPDHKIDRFEDLLPLVKDLNNHVTDDMRHMCRASRLMKRARREAWKMRSAFENGRAQLRRTSHILKRPPS